jgi:hypothetical protein
MSSHFELYCSLREQGYVVCDRCTSKFWAVEVQEWLSKLGHIKCAGCEKLYCSSCHYRRCAKLDMRTRLSFCRSCRKERGAQAQYNQKRVRLILLGLRRRGVVPFDLMPDELWVKIFELCKIPEIPGG